MSALLSFPPDGPPTGFFLSNNAFWRLSLGVIPDGDDRYCPGLIVYYPGNTHGAVPFITLAKAPTTLPSTAEVNDGLTNLVKAVLKMPTMESAMARCHEAFNLFGNIPRIKKEHVEPSAESTVQLVKAYWLCREWLMSQRETTSIDACGTLIICRV